MDKMKLNHTVLFAKGWYKKSKYLWQDFKRTIECDGQYAAETRHDVAQILMLFVSKYFHIFVPYINNANAGMYVVEEIRNHLDRMLFLIKEKDDNDNPYIGLSSIDLYDEATILFCYTVLREASINSCFTDPVHPDETVLPFNNFDGESKEDCVKRIEENFEKIVNQKL